MNSRRLLALCGALAMLCGCATDRTTGAMPGVTVTDLAALPIEDRSARYELQPLQTVEIRVAEDANLNGSYLVERDGTIAFPLLGPVQAAGLAPAELRAEIARRLSGRFVVSPTVFVTPPEDAQPTLSLGGEVAEPGNYPLNSARSLLRAVNSAGGLTDYARLDDVLVFRDVGGQRYIGVYNLGAIQRGNMADPELQPDDIVLVGDSPARRRLDSIIQFLPLVATGVILADRLGS